MPPKQGQSQLISPVSSLKAPSCEASSSVASRSPGVEGIGSGLLVPGGWEGARASLVVFWEECAAASSGVRGGGLRFFMASDSRVCREVSSVGDWGGGIETECNHISF